MGAKSQHFHFDSAVFENKSQRRVSSLRILPILVATAFGLLWYCSNGFQELNLDVLRIEGDSQSERHVAGSIIWESAEDNMDVGRIFVPLDYFEPRKGSASIAFARRKAMVQPKKGTVFVNPGGPGGSGKQFMYRLGDELSEAIGPDYDIFGFDPRGIGETLPRVQCFPSTLHRQVFEANTVLEKGFTVGTNLSDPATRDYFIEQQREFLVLKRTQAELCAQNVGDALSYMGTATVVRDINFIKTVLEGEDALINFYGFSYGTILGAYLVNMFPDKVGRVAIDGVANPVLWADKPSQYWHADWIHSTEDTYQVFLKGCSDAGPSRCPLAKKIGESTSAIENRIDEFLEELYSNPLAVPNSRRPSFLTAGTARALLLNALQRPRQWPQFSLNLAKAMAGNGTALANSILPSYSQSFDSPDLTRLAVTCLDSPPPANETDYPTAEELADVGLDALKHVSKRFGMSATLSEPDGGCQFWPARGPERFTGPWNHTLKNPMLIVSNTNDPITPLKSGRLINSLLGNSSRLLIQDSPGHCSLGLASLCTARAVRAFFNNGTLPPNEFVCNVDEDPFMDQDVPSPSFISQLSADDQALVRSVKSIGETMIKLKFESVGSSF